MNLLAIQFDELFRRHLCRHAQFGINVAHLLSVLGTYVALLELVELASSTIWVNVAILGVYLGILAANTPFRVTVAVGCIALALQVACAWLPPAPWWIYVLIVLACHRSQVWSHRIYDAHYDMSAFQAKYRKGLTLFLLLALYELPLLAYYFMASRARQPMPEDSVVIWPSRGFTGSPRAIHQERNHGP